MSFQLILSWVMYKLEIPTHTVVRFTGGNVSD